MPSAIWSLFYNDRSCCSSRIKSPSLEVLAARFMQQHEPQQTHHLGFLQQLKQKSAQTDSLAAKFGACRFRRVSRVEDQIDDQEDGSQPRR
jgi:hypothetical protein